MYLLKNLLLTLSKKLKNIKLAQISGRKVQVDMERFNPAFTEAQNL